MAEARLSQKIAFSVIFDSQIGNTSYTEGRPCGSMSHKANTGTALPSDADQGSTPFGDGSNYYWFRPSNHGQNWMSLQMPNADLTPVGLKGVWLADYCQEVFRVMGLSQRMINKMYVKLFWCIGSASQKSQGFAFGSHNESADAYNEHDIMISVGAVVDGETIYFDKINVLKTLTHELIHAVQQQEKRLHYTWFNDSLRFTFKAKETGNKQVGWVRGEDKILTAYEDLAYEMEAWGKQTQVMVEAAKRVPDQECLGYDPRTQKPAMSERESEMAVKWHQFIYNISPSDWI